MGKARMFAAIAAAMALVLCLTGCGPRLDSEKTLGGMSYSVPSDWVEIPSYFDTVQTFTNGGNLIGASVSTASSRGQTAFAFETPESSLGQLRERIASNSPSMEDWSAEIVNESVVSNIPCVVYRASYKISESGEEAAMSLQVAYLYKPTAHYELMVSGDAVKMDDLLKTVSIS